MSRADTQSIRPFEQFRCLENKTCLRGNETKLSRSNYLKDSDREGAKLPSLPAKEQDLRNKLLTSSVTTAEKLLVFKKALKN